MRKQSYKGRCEKRSLPKCQGICKTYDANIALEEYNQTMKELDWEAFDKQQEAISDTIAETDYQLDLIGDDELVDENGNITAAGSQASSLHAQNYDSYMQQANAYAEEIQRIDAELANDPNNEKLLERRKELLELQRESVLAAEDEKQAIEDLNEEAAELRAEAMQEAMEKRAEAAKEALQDQLDAMKELIDSYTEALDRAKDLHDYRKKVADQTEKISNIEKQLSAYEGDDSEEMRATVQKLKDELETAQEDLKETEYDKYVSDQKQMLDDMYSQYEENINSRIDQIDANLERTISSIDSGFSSSTDSINSSLIGGFDSILGGIASSTGDLSSLISGEIQSATDASTETVSGTVSEYGDTISEDVANSLEVLAQIRDNTADMITAGDDKAQPDVKEPTYGNTIPERPQVNPEPEKNDNKVQDDAPKEKQITVGGKINAGNALIYEYAGDTTGAHQYFDEDPIYTVLKEQNGYLQVRHHTANSGIDGWFKKNDVKAYRTGGLVDYDGLAMVHGGKKPEMFLNAEDTENFMDLTEALRQMANSQGELMVGTEFNFGSDFVAPYVSNLVDIAPMMSSLRELPSATTTSSVGEVNFHITIDHVEDYNDFVYQLQHDKKFEKMVQDITVGRIGGGSSLAKYKPNWK